MILQPFGYQTNEVTLIGSMYGLIFTHTLGWKNTIKIMVGSPISMIKTFRLVSNGGYINNMCFHGGISGYIYHTKINQMLNFWGVHPVQFVLTFRHFLHCFLVGLGSTRPQRIYSDILNPIATPHHIWRIEGRWLPHLDVTGNEQMVSNWVITYL